MKKCNLIILLLGLITTLLILSKLTVVYRYTHSSPKTFLLKVYYNLKDNSLKNKELTENDIRPYLNKDVFIILNYDTSCGLYGKLIDIIYIGGELHIILDTYYQIRQIMILKVENIIYIRERKPYE